MSTSLSLEGKRGIVLGIANRHSIAYGIADVLSEQGAELCITYLNEKLKPFVVPLARSCFR
jgi:enoyl-[acyl-carrier protein] reductase I